MIVEDTERYTYNDWSDNPHHTHYNSTFAIILLYLGKLTSSLSF